MHIFAINDIAESAPRTHDTTFHCFDAKLPDRSVPGHVIADATDLADVEAYREHIVRVLNAMVEEHGLDAVIEALESADGLRIGLATPARG